MQQTAPVALAPDFIVSSPVFLGDTVSHVGGFQDAQLWPTNTTQTCQTSLAFGNQIVNAAGSWAHDPIIPVEAAQTSTFRPFQLSPTAPIAGPSCSSVSQLLRLQQDQ
ncbi:hypothetical protein ACEPAH_1744 [Sanghuangporus vaninii]